MIKFFANSLWFYLPGFLQKKFSYFFSRIFELKVSRFFILPYCLFFGLQGDYLEQFESDTGESNYSSYSDFFKRRYKSTIEIKSKLVWPCEGYLCDWGFFSEKNDSVVKGQKINLNSIFNSPMEVTKNYFFLNIFLHNHNYHRVHSPVAGRITKIERISGDLVFLRPWFYKRSDVSYPAFRNERVLFEITDLQNRPWYMAMVGGFGVGSIEILNEFLLGGNVLAGQEIAKFNLGSTVCLALPDGVEALDFLQTVHVGQKLEVFNDSQEKISFNI
jgi:phosphatidylserine decarboxylase